MATQQITLVMMYVFPVNLLLLELRLTIILALRTVSAKPHLLINGANTKNLRWMKQNFFGAHVWIDGKQAIVSMTGSNEITPAAYIYDLTESGEWKLSHKIVIDSSPILTSFPVFIFDNYIFISDPTFGYVGFYEKFDEEWKLIQKIQPEDGTPYIHFGIGLALSNARDNLIIGEAYQGPSLSGRALVFKRDRFGMWKQTQVLKPSESSRRDALVLI